MFQHTAARRRLAARGFSLSTPPKLFQHTAARRRLGRFRSCRLKKTMFQHTAARRRLVFCTVPGNVFSKFQHTAARRRLGEKINHELPRGSFNTQPPEGGWHQRHAAFDRWYGFNTQPPEGGWFQQFQQLQPQRCRFNTQPPEGGWFGCLKTQPYRP